MESKQELVFPSFFCLDGVIVVNKWPTKYPDKLYFCTEYGQISSEHFIEGNFVKNLFAENDISHLPATWPACAFDGIGILAPSPKYHSHFFFNISMCRYWYIEL